MGGTKKKKYDRGAAVAFVKRNQALKMLQLSLVDFRCLCIYKGIYPVEPRHKKKANKGSTKPTTYYNKKDIQFLRHEPLIQKFRETKHYVRRLKKAVGKKNRFQEGIIRDNKPVYSLKHVIKERYPSLTDALRDLDDCLNLCFAFATFPSFHKAPVDMIQLCHKRTIEFQHLVMATQSLRKVFVSIKGIYYQADIKGETITWCVSHKRGYQHPQDVDYKIMSMFARYHSVLLGHINIKLYSDSHLVYPPQVEGMPENVDNSNMLCSEEEKVDENLACLSLPIRTTGAASEEPEDDPEVDQMNAATSDDPDYIEKSKVEAESIRKLKSLFKGLKFFLGREVPREELTFVIRCCSGECSWDATVGLGSTYTESDERVTHQIVDRPNIPGQRLDRTYVQPQWVFDCINARHLLPAKDYFPGVPCPPHLSPFVEEKDGDYVPQDKVKFLKRIEGLEEEVEDEDDDSDDDEDDEEEEEEEGDEVENPEDDEEDDDEGDDSEEEDETEKVKPGKKRRREEEASDEESVKKSKVANMSVSVGNVEKVDKRKQLSKQAAEDKRLGEMMIPKKHRRLYKKIMHSKKKTRQEVRKLQEKRDKIDAEKKKKKKKSST